MRDRVLGPLLRALDALVSLLLSFAYWVFTLLAGDWYQPPDDGAR